MSQNQPFASAFRRTPRKRASRAGEDQIRSDRARGVPGKAPERARPVGAKPSAWTGDAEPEPNGRRMRPLKRRWCTRCARCGRRVRGSPRRSPGDARRRVEDQGGGRSGSAEPPHAADPESFSRRTRRPRSSPGRVRQNEGRAPGCERLEQSAAPLARRVNSRSDARDGIRGNSRNTWAAGFAQNSSRRQSEVARRNADPAEICRAR